MKFHVFFQTVMLKIQYAIVYKMTDEWYIEWQRVTTSRTTSDNEWQRVLEWVTTNDNEWQRVAQRMATNDNERQRMTTSGTTSDNKWQRVTTSDYFGYFFFFLNKRETYY